MPGKYQEVRLDGEDGTIIVNPRNPPPRYLRLPFRVRDTLHWRPRWEADQREGVPCMSSVSFLHRTASCNNLPFDSLRLCPHIAVWCP